MIWSLRLIRILLIVLIFAFSAGVDASAPQTKQETQSPATRAIGRRLNQKGVRNFGEVTPTLYRGGLVRTEGIKALKKLGMDVIVDTHANDETEETIVQSLGMKYVAIPWHCPWPHDEVFAKFLKVVHENKGKKIFVHCRLGDDRTGMMVAAYRMADEGWTANEAMTEMKSFGFTRAHHLICPSLASYEKHFPERFKNSPAFEGVRTKQ
ncbi:MAG TPA: dual specificity protein phosphatase family protein [Candidatus Eremiobacteraceae bacterium]|nr:dual specificity protein phosphatase family protein [Candidatus Eremiobacteraceae bacterium]